MGITTLQGYFGILLRPNGSPAGCGFLRDMRHDLEAVLGVQLSILGRRQARVIEPRAVVAADRFSHVSAWRS